MSAPLEHVGTVQYLSHFSSRQLREQPTGGCAPAVVPSTKFWPQLGRKPVREFARRTGPQLAGTRGPRSRPNGRTAPGPGWALPAPAPAPVRLAQAYPLGMSVPPGRVGGGRIQGRHYSTGSAASGGAPGGKGEGGGRRDTTVPGAPGGGAQSGGRRGDGGDKPGAGFSLDSIPPASIVARWGQRPFRPSHGEQATGRGFSIKPRRRLAGYFCGVRGPCVAPGPFPIPGGGDFAHSFQAEKRPRFRRGHTVRFKGMRVDAPDTKLVWLEGNKHDTLGGSGKNGFPIQTCSNLFCRETSDSETNGRLTVSQGY